MTAAMMGSSTTRHGCRRTIHTQPKRNKITQIAMKPMRAHSGAIRPVAKNKIDIASRPASARPPTFSHWSYRNDHYRPGLTMGQVGGNGPSEELLQPSPYATPSAADDDHLDIEDVGQPSERIRDVACQLSKRQFDGIVGDRCTDLSHQPLIEVCVLELRQVWIERERGDGSVGQFLHDVSSRVDVRADQGGVKRTRETGGMAQHDVGLAIGNPDQDPACSLILCHRLTPVLRSDPSAARAHEPGA
jgi:hypothetical protein